MEQDDASNREILEFISLSFDKVDRSLDLVLDSQRKIETEQARQGAEIAHIKEQLRRHDETREHLHEVDGRLQSMEGRDVAEHAMTVRERFMVGGAGGGIVAAAAALIELARHLLQSRGSG